MSLETQIEGVLFYKSAPVKKSTLVRFFEASMQDIEHALEALQNRLAAGGTRLIITEREAELVSAPEIATIIESLRKEERKAEIGKAGAETLAIILYRGPISRSDIDRIRGVQSAFILRNLRVRGLIERRGDAAGKGNRGYVYAATPELYAHLGITRREELPEFTGIMDELEKFEAQKNETPVR